MNIFKFFSRTKNKQPEISKAKKFSYKYHQHPFEDSWHYFSVLALNQEQANILAEAEFQNMFDAKQTVMTIFFQE